MSGRRGTFSDVYHYQMQIFRTMNFPFSIFSLSHVTLRAFEDSKHFNDELTIFTLNISQSIQFLKWEMFTHKIISHLLFLQTAVSVYTRKMFRHKLLCLIKGTLKVVPTRLLVVIT